MPSTNEVARDRMRRRRATPEGKAIGMARTRALSILRQRHLAEFQELYRQEYPKVLKELQAKARAQG